MKKYSLYLFDFDGTILDSMKALEFVFSVSYEHFGIPFDRKDTVEFSRIPLIEGYKKLGGKEELFPEFLEYIENALDFEESLHSNDPYPETYEFIDYLKKNNIKAGIVTSNKEVHVKDVLKIMDIPLSTFSIYMSSTQCKEIKPSPKSINMALEVLNYKGDRSDVLYVGDGMNDMLAAKNAGVDGVLIDRIDAFPDSDLYIRIHSLMELFD